MAEGIVVTTTGNSLVEAGLASVVAAVTAVGLSMNSHQAMAGRKLPWD